MAIYKNGIHMGGKCAVAIKITREYLRLLIKKTLQMIENVFSSTRNISNFFKKWNTLLKLITKELSLFSEDTRYKKYFEHTIGPKIYRMHMQDYFISCTFCSKLFKANCHEFCFSCGKHTYTECSNLLPGTFSFTGSYFDIHVQDATPWILKTPCTGFERLEPENYFLHFNSFSHEVTVANYEALEGIFFGISRDKRPCHICASVNMDIFNRCNENKRLSGHSPCNRIIQEIAEKYKVISGMIKYIE